MNINKLTMLKDRVLIKEEPYKNTTKSGIFIKSFNNELDKLNVYRTLIGTIKIIGPNVKNLKVGDRVRFGKYDGHGLLDDYVIISEKHVMVIIK